jgi:pseudomonalisin
MLPRTLGLLLCAAALFAQVRITDPIDGQRRILIPGGRHPLAAARNEAGAPEPDLPMERMVLVLAPDDARQQELERLLDAQHDPSSPDYQRWLTPEEFGERFGVSDGDLAAARDWLEKQGMTVDEIPAGRRSIVFSGTLEQVASAFRTGFRRYLVNQRMHVANSGEVEIPEALAAVVRGVSTLHNFGRQAMNLGRIEPMATASNGYHYLSPADFATIYNVNPLYAGSLDGAGQTVAVVARSNINLSDVAKFRSAMGLPANNPAIVLNGPDPGIFNQDEAAEALLDVQWSGAVARNATVKMVISESTNTTDGVDLSAQYIVNNNLAPVMTISFGNCEAYLGSAENLFWNNLYQQAAAQGITVFAASGDSGVAGCDSASSSKALRGRGVNGLASTPYNVAVGGTQFNDTQNPALYWSVANTSNYASVLSYIPEIAWNESGAAEGSGLWSTGGGASALYAKPAWQTGPGVPADGRRDVPDVSLAAAGHDAYLFVQNGSLYAIAGTSASSPAFASLMALVVQQANARQGNANARFYSLAAAQAAGGAQVFHDITSGSNSVPGLAGYSAATGYDLVTGLGSVDAYQLVTRWSSSTTASNFQVAPAAGTVSVQAGKTGTVKVSVAVSGGFNSAVALSASGLPAGLTAAFSPASLAAPGSGTSTLAFTASSVAMTGTYNVTLTAAGGGIIRTTAVAATITPAPSFTISAAASPVNVVAGKTAATPVTVAVVNGFSAAVALTAAGLPAGVTASFAPAAFAAPGSGSSTLTLSAAASATAGTYTVTLTAIGGSLTKSTNLNVKVSPAPSLGLSTGTAKLTVVQGSTAAAAITTTALNGFSSAVTLSAKGMPAGLAAKFAPATLASPGSGSATLTLTAAASTAPGAYSIVVTATGGSLAPTLTIQVTVSAPPSFTLSTGATALSVSQGSTAKLTATVAVSGGFQSAVAFSVQGLVSGLTGTFSPASLGSGTTTLSIGAASTLATGARTLTLTASGGGVTKTATITVTVTTPPLSVTPIGSAVTLSPGGSIPVAVTVKIGSGVTSSVQLSLAGAPSGLTGVFTPASFSGAGTYTTNLKLSAAAAMAKGAWTLNVTATGGSTVVAAPITLTVK